MTVMPLPYEAAVPAPVLLDPPDSGTGTDDGPDPLLPEQEWCDHCALAEGPADETAAPGMPRDVVLRSVEAGDLPPDWDPARGPGPQYDVAYLSCGHAVSQLC
ncbi:hypothetical protein [Streptomyces sp. MMS24-I29]|uniref:hypothetical protein n=1 Tax=Streptomyces sp. MMS24-I29 TaxID=3351480 RepID=UPI003C7B8BA3